MRRWLEIGRLAGAAVALGMLALGDSAHAQVFSDATAAAGISYNQYANYAAFDARIMSSGAAAGDYDNDGWVNLFVTRADDTNILYRNQGDGTFAWAARRRNERRSRHFSWDFGLNVVADGLEI